MRASGRLRVVHGRTWRARLLARLLRLPPAGDAVETQLIVTAIEGGERWRRTFGGQMMNSTQYPVAGGGVAERFGPIEFTFAEERLGTTTCFRQVGVAIVAGPLRVPLPRLCAPVVTAREDAAGSRTRHVDVRVELPLVGPLLAYTGTVEVDPQASEAQPGDAIQRRERAQGSEPAERSEAAKRRASDAVGESERRSPSDEKW